MKTKEEFGKKVSTIDKLNKLITIFFEINGHAPENVVLGEDELYELKHTRVKPIKNPDKKSAGQVYGLYVIKSEKKNALWVR